MACPEAEWRDAYVALLEHDLLSHAGARCYGVATGAPAYAFLGRCDEGQRLADLAREALRRVAEWRVQTRPRA